MRSFTSAFSTTPMKTITYNSSSGYSGPLQAAVLDWSGTCADIFVIAPAYAFVEVFEKFGVKISMQEARGPMGLRKDLHIQALTKMDSVREKWHKVHGKYPGQADVDAMFKDFVPMQLKCLPNYTKLIPGTPETVKTLREKYGLKIGNTTGFQRVMVDVLLKAAAKQGYVPDISVAGDEVTMPRPYPFMVFKNMEKLGISPVHSIVKVDDTVGGVGEGLNAGCWTVGLSDTSNYMDIDTVEQYEKMPKAEFQARAAKARETLLKTGCHYVVPDITHLPPIIEDINRRLAKGERP
jgi:phosphonoacetaldehyde hydrolase